MVARSALSRLAPVLSNARATSSIGAKRAIQAARGYATADNEHSVRVIRSYNFIH
jgi:pyruvate dehydrogenase E1 component beta subunit